MAWVNPRTWLFGETITAAKLNEMRDALNESAAAKAAAAGDIFYATGANALAKLAKGSAGQVLKMNSAENAPEWGTGLSVFTADQTSLYALTTSWADITGMSVSVTIPYDGARVIIFAAGKIGRGTAWAGLRGVVDGTADSEPIYTYESAGEAYSYIYSTTVASAGTVTVSLQSKQDGGSGNAEHGRMIVLVL